MVRRSFRVWLRLGLVIGLLLAVVKMVQARRSRDEAWTSEEPSPWPSGPEREPVRVEGPAPVDEPSAVAEPSPELEPSPEEEPEPGIAVVNQTPPPMGRVRPDPAKEAPAQGRKAAASKGPAKKAVAKKAVAKKAAAKKSAAKKSAAKKATAKKATAKKAAAPQVAWVEPEEGVCPPTHPVKAKMSSRLFHLPGMFAYNRTRADRCYPDSQSAVNDGLTRAKR